MGDKTKKCPACDLCRKVAETRGGEVVAHRDLSELGTTWYDLEERSSLEQVEVVAVKTERVGAKKEYFYLFL